jgi:hypothetical protein
MQRCFNFELSLWEYNTVALKMYKNIFKNVRMILKRVVGIIILKMRNGLNGSALGPIQHFCEDGDALSGSVERGIDVHT